MITNWSASEVGVSGVCSNADNSVRQAFLLILSTEAESQVVSKHYFPDSIYGMVCGTASTTSSDFYCLGSSNTKITIIKVAKNTFSFSQGYELLAVDA